MVQSKFSNSILLVGISLIFFNTSSIIISLFYEILLLIVSLIWSLLKIIPNSFIHYPLTSLSIGCLLYCYRLKKNLNVKNITQFFLNKFILNQTLDTDCKSISTDQLTLPCGHKFDKNIITIILYLD